MTAASIVASVEPAATADEHAACAKALAEYRQERTYLGPYEAMRAVRDRAANSYMLGVKYQLSSDEAGQLADFAMWIVAGVYLKAIYEREVPRHRDRRQRTLSTVGPMTAASQSNGDAVGERVAKAPGAQPEQLVDAHGCNETGTAARSEVDVALARLLVEIRKVMFLPPTDPTRIAVMAEKRRLLALVEAYQARPS